MKQYATCTRQEAIFGILRKISKGTRYFLIIEYNVKFEVDIFFGLYIIFILHPDG